MLSIRQHESEAMQPAPNQSVVRVVLANDHDPVRASLIPYAVRMGLVPA